MWLKNREIFTTLTEAKVLIEQWRKEYNQDCIPNVPSCLLALKLAPVLKGKTFTCCDTLNYKKLGFLTYTISNLLKSIISYFSSCRDVRNFQDEF